ncbi:MAG TPA: hypothetical protein VIR60_08040, partial [Gammaproteobacteria bacterium]
RPGSARVGAVIKAGDERRHRPSGDLASGNAAATRVHRQAWMEQKRGSVRAPGRTEPDVSWIYPHRIEHIPRRIAGRR